MRRAGALVGLLCIMGCGATTTEEPTKKKLADGGTMKTSEDGGKAHEETQDGGADGGLVDAAADSCVDHSEDTVEDEGLSCNAGSKSCLHYIGSGWTREAALANCEESAKYASATACINTGFCERKTDTACRIEEAADKVLFIFGVPDGVCTSFLKGSVIAKPEAGWPASYAGL